MYRFPILEVTSLCGLGGVALMNEPPADHESSDAMGFCARKAEYIPSIFCVIPLCSLLAANLLPMPWQRYGVQ